MGLSGVGTLNLGKAINNASRRKRKEGGFGLSVSAGDGRVEVEMARHIMLLLVRNMLSDSTWPRWDWIGATTSMRFRSIKTQDEIDV